MFSEKKIIPFPVFFLQCIDRNCFYRVKHQIWGQRPQALLVTRHKPHIKFKVNDHELSWSQDTNHISNLRSTTTSSLGHKTQTTYQIWGQWPRALLVTTNLRSYQIWGQRPQALLVTRHTPHVENSCWLLQIFSHLHLFKIIKKIV